MKARSLLGAAALLVALAACFIPAYAQEPYIGQFIYRYNDGSVYRVTVHSATHLRWEAIQGPEKGRSGEEAVRRIKVREGIYFVNWLESSGVHVSQVVDLYKMAVYAHVYDGKQQYTSEGNIVRVR